MVDGTQDKDAVAIRLALALREQIIAPRNSWLARSVDSTLEAEERATLGKAIELPERLANADT